MRERAWGRAPTSPWAAAAVGPGEGVGGSIGKGTHTNTRQCPNILDIVSVTNRVDMKGEDNHRQFVYGFAFEIGKTCYILTNIDNDDNL